MRYVLLHVNSFFHNQIIDPPITPHSFPNLYPPLAHQPTFCFDIVLISMCVMYITGRSDVRYTYWWCRILGH
jgi:hypothetical protein